MQFTNRLGLKKPDLDDAYNVNDFNENYQKISEAFAGVPEETSGFKTIDDFIGSGAAIDKKRGDTVSIDNVIYILLGDNNPNKAANWKPYGSEAFILMREGKFVPISERIQQSIYLQVGNKRRVIVRVFKEFFKNLFVISSPTQVVEGIAYSIIKGKVTVAGVATNDSELSLGSMTMKAGDTYDVKGCATGGSSSTYMLELRDSSNNVLATDYGEGTTYTATGDMLVYLFIKVANGYTASALIFDPRIQVVDGSALGNEFTLFVHETDKFTDKLPDENLYQFTCRNMAIINPSDTSARTRGKLYFAGRNTED